MAKNNNNNKKKDINEEIIKYLADYDKFLNKIAYSVSKKCPKLEQEDVKQQLILLLLTHAKSYDCEKDNGLISTYFSQIVINSANNILRRYWQIKNKVYVESISLDNYLNKNIGNESFIDVVKESSEDYLHPENFLIRTEFFDEIDKILKSLSTFDKQVFKLYMDGLSIGEIAKRYSKSKKTIYNSLSHIKEKIKKH